MCLTVSVYLFVFCTLVIRCAIVYQSICSASIIVLIGDLLCCSCWYVRVQILTSQTRMGTLHCTKHYDITLCHSCDNCRMCRMLGRLVMWCIHRFLKALKLFPLQNTSVNSTVSTKL